MIIRNIKNKNIIAIPPSEQAKHSFVLFLYLNVNILVQYPAVSIDIEFTRFCVAGTVPCTKSLAVSFCHLLIEF